MHVIISGVQYTDDGKECLNKCQKDGLSNNWCWISWTSWDYCTPSVIGKKEFEYILYS